MFTPSQTNVRQFFCQTAAKVQSGQPLDAMETIASLWIDEHPEYRGQLADEAAAVAGMGQDASGVANPFLHLSMHLTITEQCSIDQPRGIRQAVELLTARRGDLHEAHHAVMDDLGTMIWESQRAGRPPDGNAYVAAVQRRATKD